MHERRNYFFSFGLFFLTFVRFSNQINIMVFSSLCCYFFFVFLYAFKTFYVLIAFFTFDAEGLYTQRHFSVDGQCLIQEKRTRWILFFYLLDLVHKNQTLVLKELAHKTSINFSYLRIAIFVISMGKSFRLFRTPSGPFSILMADAIGFEFQISD